MNRRLLAMLFMVSAALIMRGDEILDNSSVVRMVKAGLAADVILLKIEQSQTRFDITTDALIALKTESVPDAVIKAMLLKQPAPQTPKTPPPPSPAPAAAPATTSRCITTTFYTLGSNGWAWTPAGLCIAPSVISVDEQDIKTSAVTVSCFVKPMLFDAAGTKEWWFSDSREVFKFRGKESELTDIANLLAHEAPNAKRGACNDRGITAVLPK
jgi:hypothetical protein